MCLYVVCMTLFKRQIHTSYMHIHDTYRNVAITRHLHQKCLSMKCSYVHVSACICRYWVSICMYLVCGRLFSKGHLRLRWASGVLQPPGRHCCSLPRAATRHPIRAGIRQPPVLHQHVTRQPPVLHQHVTRGSAAPCSTSSTSTRLGSGIPLFYINTWAMIWPTDYPALAGAAL
jgi:hypothetical protein